MDWGKAIWAALDFIRRLFIAWEQDKAEQRGEDNAELKARRKADADRAAIDAARGRMPAPEHDPYNRDN